MEREKGLPGFSGAALSGAESTQIAETKIDYIAAATLLLAEKRKILLWAIVAGVVVGGIAFLMKPNFTSEAIFLPPQTSPGSAATQLASQVSSMGALGALSGLKNPGELYLGILGSRTIADELIKKFDLGAIYDTKKISDTRKVLKSHSKFVLGKDSLITITVVDKDPNRAADLANGYLNALRGQNGRLALTEASQRRLFFEEQLEAQKNALADAEVELKKMQEKTGLIAPMGQAQVEIQEMAQIRAEITSRQVQLAALREGATDENPQVVLLKTQIAGLEARAEKLQSNSVKRQPGNVQVPTANVPEVTLDYIRKQRDVRYHETLFELLARQYESARLDESREAPLLQVIDNASIPDRKSGPPRALLAILGFFLGGIAGVVRVLSKAAVAKYKSEPEGAAKLSALAKAAHWRWRGSEK